LSDYLDDELDAVERQAVDEHLAGCGTCRTVLSQLRALVEQARHLPGQIPANELWDGVAARIESRGDVVVPFATRQRRTVAFTVPQLAAAGIALMVLSGGLVQFARSGAPGHSTTEIARDGQDSVSDGGSGVTISPVALADPRYEDAVQDLERTLADGRGRLDPETVRVLEQNLATIDKAIAQSRQALEADPGNIFLNSHLISARQRKLALLRRATALTTGS
jgi:hypothetical protein